MSIRRHVRASRWSVRSHFDGLKFLESQYLFGCFVYFEGMCTGAIEILETLRLPYPSMRVCWDLWYSGHELI